MRLMAPVMMMLAVACASAAPKPTAEPECFAAAAIACVNGQVIPFDALQAELDRAQARAEMPDDQRARVAANIVKRLIEAELLAQAVARAGITVSEAEIEAGLAVYKARFHSEEQFDNYLLHGRVSLESIVARIHAQVEMEKLVAPRVKVSREDVLDFYQKNERFYRVKAGVHASHILVPLEPDAGPKAEAAAQARVREVQRALSRGEDFASVAFRLSAGPAAAKGGDLGWVEPGRVVEEVDAVVSSMAPGEVSGPVRSRFGWHIIKVHERREERTLTFDEVEAQVREAVEQRRFFEERRMLLAELTRDATIVMRLPRELQMLAHSENLVPDKDLTTWD